MPRAGRRRLLPTAKLWMGTATADGLIKRWPWRRSVAAVSGPGLAAKCATGRPPPIAAHGAIVDAHYRGGRLDAALGAVQTLVDAGGAPDERVYDRLVDAAMRAGDFRRALQVEFVTQHCPQGSMEGSLRPTVTSKICLGTCRSSVTCRAKRTHSPAMQLSCWVVCVCTWYCCRAMEARGFVLDPGRYKKQLG